MRVRTGGSHHQKFVVIRHRDDPRARHRVRRRHRPVPLPARRRRPPGRPAGADAGRGVRRHAAVARRPGGDHRARPSTTSRPSSGSGGRTRPRSAATRSTWPSDRMLGLDLTAGPAAGAGPAAPPVDGWHPRRPAAADLPEPAARPRLPVRPGRRAQRRPRLLQGARAGPGGWSTSRTSTSGATTSATSSPTPLREQPGPARGRGGPAVPGPRRAPPRPPQLLGRRRVDARDDGGRARPGRGLRHREPRRHAGLRARQGLRHRRRLGEHRLGQLQPALLDPRLRAVRGGASSAGRGRTPAASGSPWPPSTSTGSTRSPSTPRSR